MINHKAAEVRPMVEIRLISIEVVHREVMTVVPPVVDSSSFLASDGRPGLTGQVRFVRWQAA
jgi:hypothetical protein